MNAATALASAYITMSAPVGRRGFKRFMRLVSAVLPAKAREVHTVRLAGGQSFSFPAGDHYWLYYFLSGTPYEDDIAQAITGMPTPSLFLDCGANFGYWSVINGRQVPTVAVEASTETCRWLRQNQRDNADSFEVVQAAITDGSAPFVSFRTTGHAAGRHISDDAGESEKIQAITVDALVREYQRTGQGPILVKLDVEGVEVEAFKGAAETLKGNSVFIYEDHGKDKTCAPTAYLLANGRRVYCADPSLGFVQIKTLEQARDAKPLSYTGYNFITLGDEADENWLTRRSAQRERP